ncbi:DMT family transporter [Flavobacterium capsici]|uniref:DMT family transporter n=1 Tax=Flavobacterium capsici TaxID=3075618 RepID=A0AA96J9X8_9FLAO|nr:MULTISPECIES: DMT family transporter [unclassified Flavobacterium]WNM19609.1 DMT family transporter [Flavobacterium sp. PMR2A8]WNM20999.1 DMT family transporter [Flavobacterium sp. PMTSA4]
MSKRTWALIAATFVSIIYGVSFTIAKDVMPQYVKPFGFIILRVFGATLLFWIVSGFWSRERMRTGEAKESIDKKDFPRIVAAAFFGVALNMLTFFKGLSYTSPISAAVIMVTTPIIVLILSAIIMKERMLKRRVFGIILGLVGTAFLILYGKSTENATDATLGNLLVFINAVSYGFYLITVKKLMDKYNAFTFVKWIYTFGLLMVIPFGWGEFQEIQWKILPTIIIWEILFVVVFTTFMTYLLNLVSMRELNPSTVAVFIYLQPLFATIYAMSLGKDKLNWIKTGSAILIFIGVYLVTQKRKVPQESTQN